MTPPNAHNIADLRLLARRRLPKGLFEYVDRGTENEVSLQNNRAAFDRIQFVPRNLIEVAKRSQSIALFGVPCEMPICIAPTGLPSMLWYEGELAIARAAAAAGIPFTLATGSLTSLEDVASKAGGNLWFQLYMWPRMDMNMEIVRRAEGAGYKTLVITIDSVVNGNREHNRRNGFTFPLRLNVRNVIDGALHPAWTIGLMGRYLVTSGMPQFLNFPAELRTDIRGKAIGRDQFVMPRNESQSWEDLRRLRDVWKGSLIVKGILHPEDALKAVSCGADGIVISNHGGRTLDGAVAPMQVLPEIRQAIGERCTIFLDSNVMRGSDVVKALALGADAVMIGRAALWGAAVSGQDGTALAINIFRTEMDRVMAYLGCRTTREITSNVLYPSSRSQLQNMPPASVSRRAPLVAAQ